MVLATPGRLKMFAGDKLPEEIVLPTSDSSKGDGDKVDGEKTDRTWPTMRLRRPVRHGLLACRSTRSHAAWPAAPATAVAVS